MYQLKRDCTGRVAIISAHPDASPALAAKPPFTTAAGRPGNQTPPPPQACCAPRASMQLHRETTTTQLALAALRAYHIALFPAPPHVGVWGWAAAVVVVVAVVAVVLSGGRLDTMPTLQQRQQPPLPGASPRARARRTWRSVADMRAHVTFARAR